MTEFLFTVRARETSFERFVVTDLIDLVDRPRDSFRIAYHAMRANRRLGLASHIEIRRSRDQTREIFNP